MEKCYLGNRIGQIRSLSGVRIILALQAFSMPS